MEFSCEREIDPVTGLLSAHLSWSYKYDPLVEEGIKQRRLFILLLGDEKSMPSDTIYISKEVPKMCETMSHFNFVYVLQQNITGPKGNIICAVVGVDTVKYNQTIAVCLTTHCEYNSQIISLLLQDGVVSESIVINDICPHGTDNLIYEFQVG